MHHCLEKNKMMLSDSEKPYYFRVFLATEASFRRAYDHLKYCHQDIPIF